MLENIKKVRTLKEKILLTIFVYNIIYAALLVSFNSYRAALLLVLSNFLITTLALIFLKYKKIDYARSMIIIAGSVFVFFVSNVLTGKSSSEFYYLPIAILPLFFFDGSRKKTFGFLVLILVLWKIQKEKKYLVPSLFEDHLPVDLFSNLNFIGSFFLTLTLSKLFLDKLESSRTELDKRNLRQEYILEGAGLGAWDWWLEDNSVTFDRRWCEMIGLDVTKTPMHLSTWDTRVHPDDRERVYLEINNYLQGKTAVYESVHRIRHANGSWVWILDRGRVSESTKDGKAFRFTGTHLEITKSKELENQLEEAQQVAKIGSWSFDLKDQTIKWSKQMFTLFNDDPAKGPPSYEAHVQSIHPEDREFWIKTVQQCISNGDPYHFRFRIVHLPDRIIWLEAIGRAIRDIDGTIVGLTGTCQDVSNLVHIEEMTKKERAKGLQNSKLSSLGEMSAGVAHEINNPLAIIAGTVHILNLEKKDYLEARPSYEVIEKATERIAKIVNGLKKFSRTSDHSNLQLHPLNQIIEDSLVLLNIRAKKISATLKFEYTDNYFINCDEIELQQVIINLVNNSFDAIKDLSEKVVLIRVTEKDQYICLQIQDSGERIKDHYIKRLFEPFFTTKGTGEGTGLGLSIVKGILDDHDATIELLLDKPQTCFEIKFKQPPLV